MARARHSAGSIAAKRGWETMRTILKTILVLALLALVPAAASADKGEIRIGLNNWAENIAVSNMWKVLLEEQGYSVSLTSAGKSVVYSGLAGDDLDIGMEVWWPKTDKPFYERFKDDITLHDAWYRGTGLGLVVPSYVDVDSIPELQKHSEEFVQDGRPAVVGIDPGSALMGLAEKAIDAYGLDMDLIGGSGPAMTAALDRAIQRKEPVVVTLWNPHWAFAEYDLKYLDDPKNIFGKGENIRWMSANEFSERYPEVTRWLERWEMNDQQLGSLMAVIKNSDDETEGARKWIGNHRDLVNSWIVQKD
jgi:glycine betaine/proline transport system substrate-binding protein